MRRLFALFKPFGLAALIAVLSAGCQRSKSIPFVEFTSVPLAAPGNPNVLIAVGGRVDGAHPDQRIVLYARTPEAWWVQPYTEQPFTKIQSNSTWGNLTHPGQEYAALLVGPDFHPPPRVVVLPSEGVLASAIVKGTPPVWQRWWFLTACGLVALSVVLTFHRFHLRQTAAELNVRFAERLAERTRVAQILHDTLLQGVISSSMQLNVAVDQLPADSPALPPLRRVLQSMGQVVEEGRNTLRGLQAPLESADDLARSLTRIPQDLSPADDAGVRVSVKGPALPLEPTIRAALYAIARDAVVQALQHSKARNVAVELRYTSSELRLLVRDDGQRIPRSARGGAEHLFAIKECAARIGGRLKIRSRVFGGNEIELRLPSAVAFEPHPREHPPGLFRRRN